MFEPFKELVVLKEACVSACQISLYGTLEKKITNSKHDDNTCN